MKISTEDIWADTLKQSAVCITTNGTVKVNGRGVMGRGVAQQALKRYTRLDWLLGKHLKRFGNHVGVLIDELTLVLVCFPVKHHWSEPADLALIERSTRELVVLADDIGWKGPILLPWPGCGNGQRTREEVEPILVKYLDDRFVVTDGSGR